MTTYTRKQFKAAVEKLGFTAKIKRVSFADLARASMDVASIYDRSTLVNTGVMTPEHYERYKQVFDLLNEAQIKED